MAETVVDKEPAAIRTMFAGVAPRYDLLNHVLSGFLDSGWRRQAARRLGPSDSPVLDLCSGTGDLAVAVGRRGPRVVSADFCYPMLALGRPKFARLKTPQPVPVTADGLQLPFEDASFGATTVGFGVRNMADLDQGLREIARVTRPGGRLIVLEFALPRLALVRKAYLAYFRHVLPRIGRLVSGHGSAYDYLPASVSSFPQRDDFLRHLEAAGFEAATWDDRAAGTVCLYSARRTS